MRITNLFSGFTLAVSVLVSSLAMAAESHAQHENKKPNLQAKISPKIWHMSIISIVPMSMLRC